MTEPCILNLETATDVCSVCVSRGGRVAAIEELAGNQHAAQITQLVAACLEQAGLRMSDLDAVAVSDGPGSYTSLRTGAATAKGICYALDIPMIAVDTLSALAFAALTRGGERSEAAGLICPMIDARRMEVYTALFQYGGERPVALTPEFLRPVEPLQALVVEAHSFEAYFAAGRPILFCGTGAEKCKETIRSPLARFDPFVCSAVFLAPFSALAYGQSRFADPAYYTPRYLKEPHITAPRAGPKP